VVDFVSHDPKTDTVILSMVEEREWGHQGALLADLQAKLNAYLAYVLDGQLEREYPKFRGKAIRFRLHYEFEPGTREIEFLAIVRAQHLEPAGIGWEQSRVGA
jgi:hypothetical protein